MLIEKDPEMVLGRTSFLITTGSDDVDSMGGEAAKEGLKTMSNSSREI